MIISVLSQKGGAGKTTLAVHLAMALVRQGARVLLIDADPQGSALDWSAARTVTPALPVLGLPKPVLHREAPPLAAGYDHLVIDGPPRVTEVTRSAVLASDVVLIPVQPSGVEVWAASSVVSLLTEAAMVRPNLKAAFVISRKMVNTALARDVPGTLADYRLRILKASLAQRVAFAESLGAGLTVFDMNPKSAASAEVEALTKEVMEFARGEESDSGAASVATNGR